MVLVCPVCIFLGVISNQSTSKKPQHGLEISKTITLLLKTQGPSSSEVARLTFKINVW